MSHGSLLSRGRNSREVMIEVSSSMNIPRFAVGSNPHGGGDVLVEAKGVTRFDFYANSPHYIANLSHSNT